MTSPFPGMDPFIESCGLWEDFHSHLIEGIAGFLAERLPGGYLARTGERSYVVVSGPSGEEKHFGMKPDIAVTGPETKAQSALAVAEMQTEELPLTLRAFLPDTFRETFVEVRQANEDETLVTAIEVLSPSNKRKGSTGWEEYLRKRQALLMGTAHFIEIDLLRGGQRMPMLDAWPASPYYLLVARRSAAPVCKVWPAYSLRALAPIPVPLLAPDPDLSLPLQPLVDSIYRKFRYHRSIDYNGIRDSFLSQEEAQWLASR